jgi:acyl dehydratase
VSPARTVAFAELPGLAGEQLGVSEWHEVTQEQVRLFAEATGDHQWIHVDVERARSGPFGAPIAHGFLTLSLYPALKDEILAVEGAGLTVNYGLNKVRFPAPVPVGSRLRLRLEVASAEQRPDGSVEAVFALTFELEGGSKPVCVAESILRFLPPARD